MSQVPGARPPHGPRRSSTLIELRDGPPPDRSATLIEADEAPAPPRSTPAPAAPRPAEPERGARPYRPTARPPVAVLTVFDDGQETGEEVRIRASRFVIGRTEGDFLLPHDARVTSRHVEIVRHDGPGGARWVVTDLQSTNGTFVRVRRAALLPGSEILVGGGRYRFESPTAPVPETIGDAHAAPPGRGQTVGWEGAAPPSRSPVLVELIGHEPGASVPLMRPEYWIGSDPACPIRRPDDPFCEPRHVRLARSQAGEWSAENNKAHNGLWLRMPQFEVEAAVYFQIGEQRLRLKVR